MLRSLRVMFEYSIRATDGEVGNVHDFYFDDASWQIRYLAVNTGGWLFRKEVLLSPGLLGPPDWGRGTIPVRLTSEQVRNSAGVDTHKPVFRQAEEAATIRHVWPAYWPCEVMVPQLGIELSGRTVRCEAENAGGDPHLRSVREVIGYHVEARDGRIGSVSDMIADDETWRIRHLAIDPESWLYGQQTLVVPLCVSQISWANRAVAVNLTADQVRDGLPFDPAAPVNLRHEIHFHDYCGRPKRLEPGAAGVITPAGRQAPTERMMVQGLRNG